MSQHLSVCLTDEQREALTKRIRAGVSPARVQTRARILLLADRSRPERRTQKQIAQALQVCELTVGTTCRRFILEGLESALSEKPRPGKVPKITGMWKRNSVAGLLRSSGGVRLLDDADADRQTGRAAVDGEHQRLGGL